MESYLVFIYAVLAFFVFLLGICIGSFLNVLIYRVPRGEAFALDRSRCPSCKNQIAGYDLIPVLSYLLLRGRCRSCKSVISVRYPLIELLSGLLALLTCYYYDFSPVSVPVFLIGALLLTVAMVDFDTMTIPDGFIIALIPFALASVFLFSDVGLVSRVVGFFCVSLPMLILALLIPGGFGGGDIKLMAVCGFLLGWQQTLLSMFIAIMLGGVAAVILLVTGRAKKGSHIPFGPALCIGVYISLLFGDRLISWYLHVL